MARRGRPPLGPQGSDGAARRLSAEEEERLAGVVAEAYYLDDRTMVQIAEEQSLTRFQVARLLQLAKQTGIVTIEVRPSRRTLPELGAAVAEALGIERAVIVSSPPHLARDDVALALARLVEDEVQEGDVLGVTWSRTMLSMARQLRDLRRCTVVQLAGHLASSVGGDGSVELVRELADAGSGRAYPIYAPMIAPDAYVARALQQQPDLGAALELFDRLGLAVVSIGAWGAGTSAVFDALQPADQALATQLGVVGELSGRLFDGHGREVPEVIDQRVIGISLQQIRDTPRVIASAYGHVRAGAVVAAASASLLRTLVADEQLALAVLERTGRPWGDAAAAAASGA